MIKFWEFRQEAEGGETELRLMGYIGSEEDDWYTSATPGQFLDELKDVTGDIYMVINSYGGDAYAGQAIYQILMDHKEKTGCKIRGEILSMCASAATLPAMACDELVIGKLGTFMIHNPACMAYGDWQEMEKTAGILKQVRDQQLDIYAAKCKQALSDIAEWMDVERYLTADEAVEKGFCDSVKDNSAAPAEKGKVKVYSYSLKGAAQIADKRAMRAQQQAKEQMEKEAAALLEKEKALAALAIAANH